MSEPRLGVFAWRANGAHGYDDVELSESETRDRGFHILDDPGQLSYIAPRKSDYLPATPEEASSLRRGELPDRFKAGCISHAPTFTHVNSDVASIGVAFDDVPSGGTLLDWLCHPLDGATSHADRSSNNNLYFVHQSQDELPVIYFRVNEGDKSPANVNHSYAPPIAYFDRSQAPTPEISPPPDGEAETPHHPLFADIDTDMVDDGHLPTPGPTPKQKRNLEDPHHPHLSDADTDGIVDDRQWVAFDVQDFEARNAPLGFLDTYTQKSNGWSMIRNKAMIPEEYITRLPYKSPCLFHGDGSDDDDGTGSVRLTTRGVGASRALPNDEQFLAVAIFVVTATTNDDDRLDQLLALKRAQPKAAHQIAEAARNTSEALSNKLKNYPNGAPTLCNLSGIVAQIDKDQDKSNEEKAELLYAVGHGNQSAQNAIFEQIRKDMDAHSLKCNGLLNAVKSRFPAAAREIEHRGQDTETPTIGLLPDAHAEQDDDADTYDWENDRAFQYFSRRLDTHEHLHHHRLHPVSRFTEDEEKDCRHCQAKILLEGVSKAAKVCPGDKRRAQKNWNELNERHQKTLNDLSEEDLWRQLDLPQCSHEEQEMIKAADEAVPWRGTHCPICRVAFTAIQEHTVTEHWAIHRFNYVSWIRQQKAKAEAETNNGEPLPNYLSDMKVDSLLQYEMNRKSAESDIASLSNCQLNTRLHYIEKLCNLAENEVLEREEFCRLCYKTFNHGDSQLAKHYKRHRKEHMKQKIITDNALNADLISSTSTSPSTPPRQRAGQAALRRSQDNLEAERRKILDIRNNDPFIFAVNVGVLPDIAAQQTKLSSQEGSPKVSSQQKGKAGSKWPSAEHGDFQFEVSPRSAKLRKRDHSRHAYVETFHETDTDEDLFVAPYFFDETALYGEQANEVRPYFFDETTPYGEQANDVEPEYLLDDIADDGDELDLTTSSVDEDGSDSDSHEDMEVGQNAKPEVDSEMDTEAEEEVEGEEKPEDDSDLSSEEEAEHDRDIKSDPESSSDAENEVETIRQSCSKSNSDTKKRRISFKEDFYGELPSPLSCSESLTPPPKPKRRKVSDATFCLTEEDYPSPPITPKRRSRKATPAKKTHKKVTPVKRSATKKTNVTLVEVPAGYKKGDSPISNRTRHKRPRKEMWKL
ncbi:hypothetical protein BDV97DRAFT_369577 [Delphinella strobiligena]|nr:hypothetical protein BDV97DRAFT_369577 [Delphinella strobiligena]